MWLPKGLIFFGVSDSGCVNIAWGFLRGCGSKKGREGTQSWGRAVGYGEMEMRARRERGIPGSRVTGHEVKYAEVRRPAALLSCEAQVQAGIRAEEPVEFRGSVSRV